jgi:hypothetical protein
VKRVDILQVISAKSLPDIARSGKSFGQAASQQASSP